MSFTKKPSDIYRGAALVLVAAIGGACGFAVSARKATACTCAPPDVWSLGREAVTSSDPQVNHTPIWPTVAQLVEGPTEVVFTGLAPGGVSSVRASR